MTGLIHFLKCYHYRQALTADDLIPYPQIALNSLSLTAISFNSQFHFPHRHALSIGETVPPAAALLHIYGDNRAFFILEDEGRGIEEEVVVLVVEGGWGVWGGMLGFPRSGTRIRHVNPPPPIHKNKRQSLGVGAANSHRNVKLTHFSRGRLKWKDDKSLASLVISKQRFRN